MHWSHWSTNVPYYVVIRSFLITVRLASANAIAISIAISIAMTAGVALIDTGRQATDTA